MTTVLPALSPGDDVAVVAPAVIVTEPLNRL